MGKSFGGVLCLSGKVRKQTNEVGKAKTGHKKKVSGRAYKRELFNRRRPLLEGDDLYEFNHQDW